jgi:hypothetical protein
MEIENINKFIEDVYYYKCKKIENLEIFLQENKKHEFLLGIIKEGPQRKQAHKIFMELVSRNKNLIQGQCYYHIKTEEQKSSKEFENTFYTQTENFIIAYNQHKINIFSDFEKLIQFPDKIDFLINKAAEKLTTFIIDFMFPEYLLNFDEELLFSRISYTQKHYLYFSFNEDHKKQEMENLLHQFLLMKNDTYKNYLPILVNMKDFNQDEKSMFAFAQKEGVYITSSKFRHLQGIFDDITIENVLEFVERYHLEQQNKANVFSFYKTAQINQPSYTPHKQNNEKNNEKKEEELYVPAKIISPTPDEIQKLENVEIKHKKEEESHKRVEEEKIKLTQTIDKGTTDFLQSKPKEIHKFKLFTIFLYLFVYSIIFYLIYTKYFKKANDETKES